MGTSDVLEQGSALHTRFLYLLRFAFVLILVIRGRTSQSRHLVDDTESSQLVKENVPTFIHQVSDDLQSQEVTVVVILKHKFLPFKKKLEVVVNNKLGEQKRDSL